MLRAINFMERREASFATPKIGHKYSIASENYSKHCYKGYKSCQNNKMLYHLIDIAFYVSKATPRHHTLKSYIMSQLINPGLTLVIAFTINSTRPA